MMLTKWWNLFNYLKLLSTKNVFHVPCGHNFFFYYYYLILKLQQFRVHFGMNEKWMIKIV